MALEYNAENFTDALTRLPEYGGYEALAGALGESYPEATFSPYNDSYDKGFRYVNMPTPEMGGPTTGPFAYSPIALQKLAGANIGRGNVYDSIYKAVWPSLTGLVNPQRNIVKTGPTPSEWELETAANAINPVGGGGEHLAYEQPTFPKTEQGHKDYLDWLFTNQSKTGYSPEEIMRLGAEFQKQIPIVTPTVGTGVTPTVGTVEKKATHQQKNEIKQHLDGGGFVKGEEEPIGEEEVNRLLKEEAEAEGTIPHSSDIVPPIELSEVNTDSSRDGGITGPLIPPPNQNFPGVPAGPPPVVSSKLPQLPSEEPPIIGQNEPIYADKPITSISSDSNVTTDRPTNIPSPKANTKIERADKSYLDITSKLDDNTKAELEGVTAQANKLLTSKGWSDSGNWGYARTRNMLTGGGLGPVVTEGALVPWKSLGQDASSADYISNVGGQDYFPSRLSEADRLKSGSSGELSYVPEGEKADYLRQNYGTSGGGEGRTPFNTFLSESDNVDPASLSTAITNFNRLKTHEFTANTFTGVVTTKGFVETILSPVKGLANAGENLVTYLTDKLGISDSNVKDPGFFKWLNTPLDAISTKDVGIKPVDIIMIAAGGMTGLTTVAVGKVMAGLLNPITSRINGTIKELFSGDVDELSDADKNDVMNEWEGTMDVEAEDTNIYNPHNKLDVLTSGDYFISDPDRDAADQIKNLLLDGFESGNILNLSGQRVAVFTDSFGNSVNVHDTNIDAMTSDIILGPNNQAYGVRSDSSGDNTYAITTTNGQPITMSEWNNGKVAGAEGGGGMLKTLQEWVINKIE